jgi:hypothetical protein
VIVIVAIVVIMGSMMLIAG